MARAHTLAVLEGLDPARKRVLLGLLHESNLIDLEKPIISLLGANLKGANLKGAHLPGANLKGADLRGADLREAYLKEADLKGADLRGADLRGAATLNQEQIDQVIRDEDTKLPDHLQRPVH